MRSKRIAASVMAAALCLGTALPYSAAAEVNIRPAADQQTNKRDTANEAYSVGDVDGNGTITGVDASKVLSDYAVTSVGGKSELSDRAKKAADVDRNGVINGVDASKILSYYAFCSAGGELTFPEFLFHSGGFFYRRCCFNYLDNDSFCYHSLKQGKQYKAFKDVYAAYCRTGRYLHRYYGACFGC